MICMFWREDHQKRPDGQIWKNQWILKIQEVEGIQNKSIESTVKNKQNQGL